MNSSASRRAGASLFATATAPSCTTRQQTLRAVAQQRQCLRRFSHTPLRWQQAAAAASTPPAGSTSLNKPPSRVIRPMGLRLRPRLNRRRARAWTTSRSCSLERSRSLGHAHQHCGGWVVRVILTHPSRYRGMRTCGMLSSSSTLKYETTPVSRYPIFHAPLWPVHRVSTKGVRTGSLLGVL